MLSERLKEFRKNEGLTQKELAIVLDSSQNTISQYESGKRMPTVKKLVELSTLLGCSIDELTRGCPGDNGVEAALDCEHTQ